MQNFKDTEVREKTKKLSNSTITRELRIFAITIVRTGQWTLNPSVQLPADDQLNISGKELPE